MRLIDADALIERWNNMSVRGRTEFDQEIMVAPSIEIIRCGECKWLRYCETEEMELTLDCDHPDGGGIPRSEEWFCADGERKGQV